MRKTLYFALLLGAALAGAGKAYLDNRLERALADYAAADPALGLNHAGAKLTLDGAVELRDVSLKLAGLALNVERLRLPGAYRLATAQGRRPPRLDLNAEGLALQLPATAAPPPPLLAALGYAPYHVNFSDLHKLGFARLGGDGELRWRNQPHGAARYVLNLRGAGRIELEWETAGAVSAGPFDLATLPLRSLTLNYRDDGLLAKLVPYLAARAQLSPDLWREQLRAKLETDARRLGLALAPADWAALRQLLESPRGFTLQLRPPQPLSFNQLVATAPANFAAATGLRLSVPEHE